MQQFEIPCDADQIPFPTDCVKTAHKELAETHDSFNDTEYRLHSCLSLGVEPPALFGLKPISHFRYGIGTL